MPNDTDTITICVEHKDPAKVIILFAEELAKFLIESELLGAEDFAKCENDREQEIFASAYKVALIDYLTARTLGHVGEPVFETKKV
jgi:hypothetical protein